MTDEDVLVLPEGWQESVHPRRGGLAPAAASPDPQAPGIARVLTRDARPVIDAMVRHPDTPAELADAVRAWLGGTPDPVGAAAVASIIVQRQGIESERLRTALVEAWAAEHGLPFAACAFTELCGIRLGFASQERPPEIARVRYGFLGVAYAYAVDDGERHGAIRHATHHSSLRHLMEWWWGEGTVMRRLRTLLAAASDEEYQEAVARLARHRDGDFRKLAVSYLVPTEHEWVEECLSTTGQGRGVPVPALQFFCSLSTARHAELFERWWLPLAYYPVDHRRQILATLADGMGAAAVPLLTKCLPGHHGGAGVPRDVLAALAALPCDEAFQELLDRIGQQEMVREVLRWAAERFPVRAIRMLAPVATNDTTDGLYAAGLLRARLRSDPALGEAVARTLPPDDRERLQPLVTQPTAPEADPADLPDVLVTPPWTRPRAKRKPVRLDGLPIPAVRAMVWEAGEREAWADTVPAPVWIDDEAIDWDAIAERWAPVAMETADRWLRPVVARYGLDALPLVLKVAERAPSRCGTMLLPYLVADAARTMAGWLTGGKSARSAATRWFLRHGAAAVPLLVPAAFGKAGPDRRNAERALCLLAAQHGDAQVVEAAGERAARAVEALIALSADVLPRRIPDTDWVDTAALPRILLRGRDRALPADAARHVLTMLAMSKPGDEYAGLGIVRDVCDPASLAEFSWDLFLHWYAHDTPAKEKWAMLQLALLGDDVTVHRLTPLIRIWPGERHNARAVTGLDILAGIGSDVALTHLHALARKGRHQALKAGARQKVREVATARGLTADQLADRAVPDFGLDADGGMTIDYGPRRFTLGFDEQLRPVVVEDGGRRRQSLPKPGPGDDPHLASRARARFSGLRRDVREIAETEIRRLETAMVGGRRWSPREFRELFVSHPLMWHITRRLVWLAEHDGVTTAFRVAEDRNYADVDDDAFDLPGSARVGVAHPYHLGDGLGAWSDLFADYEIIQSFPQLARPVHTLGERERTATRLTRLEGRVAPYGKAKGLSQGRWERSGAGSLTRSDPSGRTVFVALSPGLGAYMRGGGHDQVFTAIWAGTSEAVHPDHASALPLGAVHPVTMSEVIYDLTRVSS